MDTRQPRIITDDPEHLTEAELAKARALGVQVADRVDRRFEKLAPAPAEDPLAVHPVADVDSYAALRPTPLAEHLEGLRTWQESRGRRRAGRKPKMARRRSFHGSAAHRARMERSATGW